MIGAIHAELIKKYTFIDDAFIKNSTLYIYYTVDGERKKKKLPIRATHAQLKDRLNKIRKELEVNTYGAPRRTIELV